MAVPIYTAKITAYNTVKKQLVNPRTPEKLKTNLRNVKTSNFNDA
jgi:hypothetical protein